MSSVSVVIATYNCGQYLVEALRSVLAQTSPPQQIVIVDDGSTDNTPARVAPYLAEPGLSYLRRPHLGHARAKNFAASQARCEWLAFLDADDVWMPDKLERQLELAATSRWAPSVIYSRRLAINGGGEAIDVPELPPARGDVLHDLLLENFVCFSSALVRREVWQAVGPFDEDLDFPIDYHLWLRLALRHTFDYVDSPLVQYRMSEGSMSQSMDRLERRRQIDLAMSRFLDHHGGRQAVSAEILQAADVRRSCRLALETRYESRLEALSWYLRALRHDPLCLEAWYGLAALPVPESARRVLRRALRRPVDWRDPPLVSGPVAVADSEGHRSERHHTGGGSVVLPASVPDACPK